MRKRRAHYEMDMTSGPLFSKIMRFSFPLMLTGLLQLLYNAADIVVVGKFAGPQALAAVGSTGSLINLIVNLFMGLSIGASVVVAQHYGAGQHKDVSGAVHTSILIALISGVAVAIFGVVMARPLLVWMKSPEDVLDLATLYLRIYFLGMPAMMLYNFGAAILRAVGDTKRPLYFLGISGVVNIGLNLLFVIVFDMSVAGVAISTVIAQCVSLVLILLCLMRAQDSIHLDVRKLRIQKDKLLAIAKVGLPAGLQGMVFSFSNVLIQSTVNSFGSSVMAGNAAAGNIEGFVYMGMNAVYQAALTFTSQNIGAKKFERIGSILRACLAAVMVIGVGFSALVCIFRMPLLSIYSSDPEVIQLGSVRILCVAGPYFICGIMDVLCGMMRGMGKSLQPMVISLIGVCLLRVVWIYTIFAIDRSLISLYISYPVSWAITSIAHSICYVYIKRKLISDNTPQRVEVA